MAETTKKGKSERSTEKVTCAHCKTPYPRTEDLPWTDNDGKFYCNSCGAFLPRVHQRKICTA